MENLNYKNNVATKLRRNDIVLPDLSYFVVGVLFDIYNDIGFGHLERVYQKAIADTLKYKDIKFSDQPSLSLQYRGTKVGRYIPDFIIANSLVLELKRDTKLKRIHFDQANAYLKATNYPLSILASFNKDGVEYRRLVNTY
jgi:GxxExxY protein